MGYWLVLIGSVVTLLCFILHRRGVFRFVYLSAKFPGPSVRTVITEYAKDYLLMRDAMDLVTKITRRSYFKPWGLWVPPNEFMIVISDVDTVSEVLTNKNFFGKSDLVYKTIHCYLEEGTLISVNGEKFKRHRKAVAPAFRRRFIEQHLPRINGEATLLVEEDLRSIANGDSVDVRHFVHMRLLWISFAIFTSGTYMPEPTQEAIHMYQTTVQGAFDLVQLRSFYWFHYWLWHKHMPSTKQLEKTIQAAKAAAQAVFLEELHAREGEDAAEKPSCMADFLVREISQGDGIENETEAFNETMFLLFAGAETSTFTINVLLQMLALHQDVQELVRREVESVLGDRNEVGPDDLAKLVYLEKVIKETLRIFPVAPMIGRIAAEETTVGGLTVPKGAAVMLNILAIHRSPDIYEDPYKFDPERFTPEAVDKRHPYAWLGFSNGYRICPGMLQGMYLVKTIVSHVVRNFSILPGVGLDSVHDLKFKMAVDWHLVSSSLRFIPRQHVLR